jgi:hypothetical protein
MSRMIEVRGMFLTEAAEQVMRDCYMKASDNNRLPATARQIYYVARPLIEERTDKPLRYDYFSQTLLPNYINEHPECADWDVVYDDRGHFVEPHTKRVIGLGTLNVRHYLNHVDHLKLEDADFASASVKTYGPTGSFGAVLYVEKEGFMPLFERVKLAQRFDIAIMSSKAMSVTAARELVNYIGRAVPLLMLHDFDSAGIIIKDTMANDTRRYTYTSPPNVIDLGLHYGDIADLPSEPNNSAISDERLSQAGLDQDAIDFLSTQRVEAKRHDFAAFCRTQAQAAWHPKSDCQPHDLGKHISDVRRPSDRLSEAFDELKEKLNENEAEGPIRVPNDLEAKVETLLKDNPDITWHRAIRLIVDPDAPEDEDDEEDDGQDEADEDLSDVSK